MSDELGGKMPCYNYGTHCLNPCVAQCDLGDGKCVQWYCRSCIENADIDEDNCKPDDTLIFCETEWKLQGK